MSENTTCRSQAEGLRGILRFPHYAPLSATGVAVSQTGAVPSTWSEEYVEQSFGQPAGNT